MIICLYVPVDTCGLSSCTTPLTPWQLGYAPEPVSLNADLEKVKKIDGCN